MANPRVREPLKKMGFWARLVDSVRKFFTTPQKSAVVEAGMAKDEEFERTSAYNELSKTLDKFLNNFDQKSYDAYVAVAGGGRHDKKVEVVDDRENKIDDKDRKSDELFLSLQNKKGKDYYDTVSEIARRVSEGKAVFTSLPEEYESRGVISVAQAAGRAITSAWLRESEDGSTGIGTGTHDGEFAVDGLGNDGRDACESEIEEWAKQNDCWINEEDYASKGYETNRTGMESTVYFVGDKVVKFVDYKTLHEESGIDGFLERVTIMNTIDPESACKIVGYSRDKNGDFRIVLEQKRFAKAFNYDVDEDKWLTDKGIEQLKEWLSNEAPKVTRQLATKGIEYDSGTSSAIYNSNVEITDLSAGNFACDENGKYHIIDGNAILIAEEEGGDWGVKDISSSEDTSTDNGPHFRVATSMDEVGRPQSESVVEYRVQKLGGKLGTHVNMIYEAEDIPDPKVKASVEAGKKVTGWYDEKTGKVYLYMPNVKDTYTAEKTIWHEVVGHKGLRGLFGSDFNKLMRTLWYDIDSPINKELKAYVSERMKKDPMSIYDAIEEYLADAAEKGKGERGFWNYR